MVKRVTTPLPAPIVNDESAMMEEFEAEADEALVETPAQVQAAAPPPPKAGVRAPAPKITMPGHKGMRTMKILLEESEHIPPSGQFIGHNGVSYMLRPGMWVEVPIPIIEILNNAVMKVPDRDPVTNQIIGWREKLRYPYRTAPASMSGAA